MFEGSAEVLKRPCLERQRLGVGGHRAGSGRHRQAFIGEVGGAASKQLNGDRRLPAPRGPRKDHACAVDFNGRGVQVQASRVEMERESVESADDDVEQIRFGVRPDPYVIVPVGVQTPAVVDLGGTHLRHCGIGAWPPPCRGKIAERVGNHGW